MWHPRSETIHFSSQSTALTSYSAHCARGQKGNVRVPQSMVCEDGTSGAREKHCVCTDTFGTGIMPVPGSSTQPRARIAIMGAGDGGTGVDLCGRLGVYDCSTIGRHT